jgi:hypothetical protein
VAPESYSHGFFRLGIFTLFCKRRLNILPSFLTQSKEAYLKEDFLRVYCPIVNKACVQRPALRLIAEAQNRIHFLFIPQVPLQFTVGKEQGRQPYIQVGPDALILSLGITIIDKGMVAPVAF